MRTLLFDTDLGDDVDDAAALVCALLSPRCKLLAVTTVYGDTVARAQLARKIIRLCKMDIPVFAGSSQPLCGIFSSQGKKPPQCATLTEEERKEPVSCVPAAKAILRLLRENPDTVLVATGPLTNLAHCVQLEPETMRKTEIMLMGGCTGRKHFGGPRGSQPSIQLRSAHHRGSSGGHSQLQNSLGRDETNFSFPKFPYCFSGPINGNLAGWSLCGYFAILGKSTG